MNFAKITSPLLYLWRPQPVVTIGRHQNPWKECVLEQLQSDQVALVRRRSGGRCGVPRSRLQRFHLHLPFGRLRH
ncbi:unnamed protein product [Durusdinium trenchii]|uniref:BPL/LPL catalytic domain-containing protein n=1 Tax=Durusdinium trenchii TaxID=1381693 RepID=A0ABP0LZA2_9DINO